MAFHEMRVAYRNGELAETAAGQNPIELFMAWIGTARGSGAILEPNAMTLATVDERGRPAARMVLLKEVEDDGSFVFYTNRAGRKGRELAANPFASLVFWWEPLERQVRIEGTVTETSDEDTAAYFATRPRQSRIGAWASNQSEAVADRAALEQRFAEADAKYPGEDVPVPPWWGGYRIAPEAMEFWQGRMGRMHDRLRYERDGVRWDRVRLQP
ncbi:MAG: pyridoxamine 5'-phosphate oxidase [Actinobacteria bacterium]|nr:pyridoxamine 5'-phosphate oxidase [Actinomycetota bacterium]